MGIDFSLDSGYKILLKDGRIHEELRKAFEYSHVSISSSSVVSKIDDKHWKIRDGKTVYLVEETSGYLNVKNTQNTVPENIIKIIFAGILCLSAAAVKFSLEKS